VYETHLKVVKTVDGDEIRHPEVEATAVVEQRVSHFLMGMAIWGTMTGPLLTVLSTMPAAVFAGVFFVVGVSYHDLIPFTLVLILISGVLSRVTAFSRSSGI
jgi:hypothetical protein